MHRDLPGRIVRKLGQAQIQACLYDISSALYRITRYKPGFEKRILYKIWPFFSCLAGLFTAVLSVFLTCRCSIILILPGNKNKTS